MEIHYMIEAVKAIASSDLEIDYELYRDLTSKLMREVMKDGEVRTDPQMAVDRVVPFPSEQFVDFVAWPDASTDDRFDCKIDERAVIALVGMRGNRRTGIVTAGATFYVEGTVRQVEQTILQARGIHPVPETEPSE